MIKSFKPSALIQSSDYTQDDVRFLLSCLKDANPDKAIEQIAHGWADPFTPFSESPLENRWKPADSWKSLGAILETAIACIAIGRGAEMPDEAGGKSELARGFAIVEPCRLRFDVRGFELQCYLRDLCPSYMCGTYPDTGNGEISPLEINYTDNALDIRKLASKLREIEKTNPEAGDDIVEDLFRETVNTVEIVLCEEPGTEDSRRISRNAYICFGNVLFSIFLQDVQTACAGNGEEYRVFKTGAASLFWAALEGMRIGETGICARCKAPFIGKKSRSHKRIYCSDKCKVAACLERKRESQEEQAATAPE